MDTGAMMAILMDSVKSKSVIITLLRVQLRFGRIEKVCKDQGANLIEAKRLVAGSNGLWHLEEVKEAPVDGHYRN